MPGRFIDVLGFADGDARGRNDPRLVARPFDAVDELFGEARLAYR
ncbi:Uncharacterised protein [Mycobacterium tuberculosis]|nr:Uncharacterised protein [Mycobacterium tuberculosis]